MVRGAESATKAGARATSLTGEGRGLMLLPFRLYLPKARRGGTAEENRKHWGAWTTAGIDPTHGGEASRKRGETIGKSNRLKPRRR
jgi:hypothetical protein